MMGPRTTAMLASFALLAMGGVSGCGAVAGPAVVDDEPSGYEREPDAFAAKTPRMWAKYGASAPACATPAPMLVHHDDAGRVDRLHATLTARGVTGHYLVDTGSLKSFATHSGNEEGTSASTVIACSTTTLPIIARLRPGLTPDGQPQSGVLGSDLVAHGAVLDLDLKKGALGWSYPAPPPPAGAVVLPIERRHGWLVASGIRLGGRDVKLVVDTGASNVIVVDKTPRAGEVREETVDGTASPITLWHGSGELAFTDGVVRHVPVDRTDDFPTLEGLITELGGDVAGLLGLTSMGRDRIVVSGNALYLVLPPEVPNPR
jgi:hypothetical protein